MEATTSATKKQKTLVFEAEDIQKKVFEYYETVVPLLNQVRSEYLELEIGPFDLPAVHRFIEQGPQFVINQYEAAFNDALKAMPKIIYGALNELPREKIARQFQVHFNRLGIARDRFFTAESMINRTIFNACTDLRKFLEVGESGEIILSGKNRKIIVELTRFYAETDDELRLVEIGKNMQAMFAEALAIWGKHNLNGRDILSIPGDKYVGLWDIDIDSKLTFNPEGIRALRY